MTTLFSTACEAMQAPHTSRPRLSLAVITHNEERRLGDCLRSVPFADEIVVVDSGSTDRTRQIAEESGARVFVSDFKDFSSQKNLAIEKTSAEWILLLDADERVTSELASEVRVVIDGNVPLNGYFVRRHNFLFGGRVRFGVNAGDWQLRLIRRACGRFEGLVHERVHCEGGTGRLRGPLLHYSHQTMEEHRTKLRLYSSLDAEAMWRHGMKPGLYHFLLKPPLEFFYFYVLKGGVLDGFRGLLCQMLSTRYLYAKYWRARRLFHERETPGR